MILTVENISFAYSETPVIRGMNLVFKPGRFYSILGPNGCGKTTFLDLLIRHLTPNSGTIFLDGAPLEECSRIELACSMALVSQNYSVNFPFTVEEVVMMGRHPHIPRFARPSRDDIRMVSLIMEMTDILGFRNRKITELSGGERQRCVLARALCQDTPVLILDEAFSNLDIAHTLGLLSLIRRQVEQENKTVISVFHDVNLAAAWSDELIFMKEGSVVVSGSTDNVLTPETVKKVFNITSEISFCEFANSMQASFPGRDSHV